MKWGKIIALAVLTLILVYTAIIYNSVSMLLPAVLIVLVPLLEGGLLLLQRRQIAVNGQLLCSYVQVGQEIEVRVQMENCSSFPLCNARLVVSKGEQGEEQRLFERVNLSGGEQTTVRFTFSLEHCGMAEFALEGVWLSDWMGWFEVPFSSNIMKMTAVVYPAFLPLPAPTLLPVAVEDCDEEETVQRGQGRDQILGVREYIPGDRLQEIHWKMSARKGDLMVREYGQNLSCQCVVVLDLLQFSQVSQQQRDSLYEKAVGISLGLLQKGYFHYMMFSVQRGEQEETLVRQTVTNEEQIRSFLQCCYRELELWQQKGPQIFLGKRRSMLAGRKAQLFRLYEAQYEPFPSENFIYI